MEVPLAGPPGASRLQWCYQPARRSTPQLLCQALDLPKASKAASALHRTPALPFPAPAKRDTAKRSAQAGQGLVACTACEQQPAYHTEVIEAAPATLCMLTYKPSQIVAICTRLCHKSCSALHNYVQTLLLTSCCTGALFITESHPTLGPSLRVPVRGGLFRIAPQRDIAPDSPDCGPATNLTLGIVFEDAQAPAGGGG